MTETELANCDEAIRKCPGLICTEIAVRLLAEVRRLRATPSPLARLEAWRSASPLRVVSINGGGVGLAEYRTWPATNGETTLSAEVARVAAFAEDRPAELGDAPPNFVYLGPGATFAAMIGAALDRWDELHTNKEEVATP